MILGNNYGAVGDIDSLTYYTGKLFKAEKGLSKDNLVQALSSINIKKGGFTNVTKQLDKHWDRFGLKSRKICGLRKCHRLI